MRAGFALRNSLFAGAVVTALAVAAPVSAAGPGPLTVDQGPNWTATTRDDFYVQYQGSQIMPLSWMRALKQPSGAAFLADSLSRYGYLPNDRGLAGLPVGFTTDGKPNGAMVGMSCAACHTRQIDVAGTAYRIDGGPAIVDFQSFLADLDTAVGAVRTDPTAFATFARAVLGHVPTPGEAAKLRAELDAWFLRFDTLIKAALPSPAWGPSRLDAVGMIFNRLTGLDLGPAPSYLIPANIRAASAPVRYPFLWNAAIQDQTQWPGFADNGNDLLGLARNLGEVYGVFAQFHPTKSAWRPLGYNYLDGNSADFKGLGNLETLIKQLGPPKWPWSLDPSLTAQGKAVFERATATEKSCADCHGIAPGYPRFPNFNTWATPIDDVGTDSREYQILKWTAETGVLDGASIPILTQPLKPDDESFKILAVSVLGSILQHYIPIAAPQAPLPQGLAGTSLPDTLKGAFKEPQTGTYAYESRVLQGIWAAAPYLHNGSVPSLAELLKPAAERTAAFKIGPEYDIVNVGLATEQTQFDYTLKTTDCSARDSGDSRCGHEYGTTLSPEDKRALLEYLKSL